MAHLQGRFPCIRSRNATSGGGKFAMSYSGGIWYAGERLLCFSQEET